MSHASTKVKAKEAGVVSLAIKKTWWTETRGVWIKRFFVKPDKEAKDNQYR